MSKITITLPDNSTRIYDAGVTPLEVAESIGSRLAMDTVAASINGEFTDANVPINEDANLSLHTGSSVEGHEVLLHSTAHLMAQAVKAIWPESQVTIGPAIENRFYYDFDIDGTFSDTDLLNIENKMREITKENLTVTRQEISRNKA
ncbi:MAG: TGS domain-containing protein, partial [Fidelibacterota bacterium]